MREHSPPDQHVEAAARQIATVLAESAPLPPDWNNLVAPAVDVEERRSGMNRNMVIAVSIAFAAAVIVIAQIVIVPGGSDSETTTVAEQPSAAVDAPTGETGSLDAGTPVPQEPSSSTTTSTTVPEATTFPLSWMTPPILWTTRTVLDPLGGLTAVYWDEDEGSIKMQRCSDPECVSPRDLVTLGPASTLYVEGEDYGPSLESIAFTPDGTPIVLIREADGESFTIYACSDSRCDSVSTSPFHVQERPMTGEPGIGGPRIAVASDGMPRVAYWDRDAMALVLAVCDDLICSPEKRSIVTVHDDVDIPGRQISLQILPDGRTFFGYGTSVERISHSATVAVCSDDVCSNSPTIHTFEDAITPRITFGEDGAFFIWYRSGPESVPEYDLDPEPILRDFDLVVAECDDSGCQAPNIIETGWEPLFAWGFSQDSVRLLQITEQTFFAYVLWSSESCDYVLEIVAFDVESGATGLAREHIEPYLWTGSVTEDGQAVVVYQSGDALHSINIQSDLLDSSAGPAAPYSGCQAD